MEAATRSSIGAGVEQGQGRAAHNIPTLHEDVWVGYFDDFRRWVSPTTEAPYEMQFGVALNLAGLSIGRTVAISYGRRLYPNFFVCLLGPTGQPRKTTLAERHIRLGLSAFGDEEVFRIVFGTGSAEGLLEQFCDEDKKGRLIPAPRRRILLDENEFTYLIKKSQRQATGNLLEALINLYDGSDLTPPTRNRSIKVRQPFLSILTASTPEALRSRLTYVEVESGFLPRFTTWMGGWREPIPLPEEPDQELEGKLAEQLRDLRQLSQTLSEPEVLPGGHLQVSDKAKNSWNHIYHDVQRLIRQSTPAVAAMSVKVPSPLFRQSSFGPCRATKMSRSPSPS